MNSSPNLTIPLLLQALNNMVQPIFELRQRYNYFKKNVVRIYDDRVEWEKNNGKDFKVHSRPFEDIDFRTMRYHETNSVLFDYIIIAGTFIIALYLLASIYFDFQVGNKIIFLPSSILPFVFLKTIYHHRYYLYFDDKGEVLFKIIKDKKDHEIFMHRLKFQASNSLNSRFGRITRLMPIEFQAKRIQWLYESGHMHEPEYERKMRALWRWRYEDDDDDSDSLWGKLG